MTFSRASCTFIVCKETVELQTLPSGHIAVDVLNFGEKGFVFPEDVLKGGLSGSDFRWTSGSGSPGDQQMNFLTCAIPNHGRPVGAVSSCNSASWRRCANGGNVACAEYSTRPGQLACDLGQDRGSVAVSWARGIVSAESQFSVPSTEQLARVILDAPKLDPMKSKVKPAVEETVCRHPQERLATGANQHGTWVVFYDCHTRWKMPAEFTKPVKSKAAAAKKMSPSSASASASEEYVSQMKKKEMEMEQQISALSEQSMQQQSKMENLARYNHHLEQEKDANRREGERWRQDLLYLQSLDHNQEIFALRSKLQEAVKGLEVTELMMSEYGAMAMGESYVQNKGYHDAEMWEYAENKMRQESEFAQLQKLTQELTQESPKRASSSTGVRSTMWRKPQNKQAKSPSPTRRSG